MVIKLLQGNCLELISKIPDKAIDMILCDLPYGTTRNKWDIVIDFDKLWVGYERVIKDNGAIILFGDGMFSAKLMNSNPKLWRYNLVWSKPQGTDFLNSNRKPLKSHEDILVFYKKLPCYNKQYWYSKPYSCNTGAGSDNYGEFKSIPRKSEDGRRCPLTVLNFHVSNRGYHPTQKPTELLEYLIKTYTNEGDLVLDNCMGSGSTGVACVNTNRSFVGIELNKEYFHIAQKRIEEAKKSKKTLSIEELNTKAV